MKLLIPGGAGYIGSHMVKLAQENGYEAVVLDDFSTGHHWATKDCEVLEVNLLDIERLEKILNGRFFDGVIHFAAKSLVAESIKSPNEYYLNNFIGTFNLITQMMKNDIDTLVFSSTAAIFGNPTTKFVSEDHPKNPINPYGKTKLMVEELLRDICHSFRFNATSLRYFNAAGAHISAEIGESHDPETHLIPNILNSVIDSEKRLVIYGNDYSTEDGTCIRDYVHVTDLCKAHLLAINRLETEKGFSAFNLGNGNGFSVLDVIKGCERVIDSKIEYEIHTRRAGDPARLVADSTKANKELGWYPKFNQIDPIIRSAWEWHRK